MSLESVMKRILFSDGRWIFIRVEGERFMFNLEILIESSEYFEAMFSGRFEESAKNEIVLEDVGLEEFKMFHEWIFSLRNSPSCANDSLLKLAIFADRFMIDGLRKRVIEDIKEIMDMETCNFACKILETSIQIGDLDLKNIFIGWINKKLERKRKTNMFSTVELLYFDSSCLVKLCKLLGKNSSELSTEANEELNRILDTAVQTIIYEYEIISKDKTKQTSLLSLLQKGPLPDLRVCDARLLGWKKFVERTLESNGVRLRP